MPVMGNVFTPTSGSTAGLEAILRNNIGPQ